jgi:hypothetical protein
MQGSTVRTRRHRSSGSASPPRQHITRIRTRTGNRLGVEAPARLAPRQSSPLRTCRRPYGANDVRRCAHDRVRATVPSTRRRARAGSRGDRHDCGRIVIPSVTDRCHANVAAGALYGETPLTPPEGGEGDVVFLAGIYLLDLLHSAAGPVAACGRARPRARTVRRSTDFRELAPLRRASSLRPGAPGERGRQISRELLILQIVGVVRAGEAGAGRISGARLDGSARF